MVEIELNKICIYAFIAILLLSLVILFIGVKKKKVKNYGLVALLVFAVLGVSGVFLLNTVKRYGSYELGAYPDEEIYYLGIAVEEDGTFEYMRKDFSTEKIHIDFDDALIAGRINTIGFNNRYKKYVNLGGYKICDSYEDMVMLSKFTAIQLGLIEAQGGEDEKEFKIATGSDAEDMIKEQNEQLE